MNKNAKVTCPCGWHGKAGELIGGVIMWESELPDTTIHACPKCRNVNLTIEFACDEPGCWRAVDATYFTPGGRIEHLCKRHGQMVQP